MANLAALKASAETGGVKEWKAVAEAYYDCNDHQNAIPWYQKAAEAGDAYAACSLGHIYFASADDRIRDDHKAFPWLKMAAEQGEPNAQYTVGYFFYFGGDGGAPKDTALAARYVREAANQGHSEAIAKVLDLENVAAIEARRSSSACIIASACVGACEKRVAALRAVRDQAILEDPVARDFFHVFWSRYYEWSPAVARLANEDAGVREHIRWSFLEPWLAWLEMAMRLGQRDLADVSATERNEILARLVEQVNSWLKELPRHLEGKCRADQAEVFQAFERIRMEAWTAFQA